MPGCGGARCGGRADAAAPAAPAECGRGGGRRAVRREEAQHAMASTSVDVVRCGAMWCYVLTRRSVGCRHGTHTNGTAYIRGTYSRVHSYVVLCGVEVMWRGGVEVVCLVRYRRSDEWVSRATRLHLRRYRTLPR